MPNLYIFTNKCALKFLNNSEIEKKMDINKSDHKPKGFQLKCRNYPQ